MNVLMVRAKIREENVADARVAIEKVIQALERVQPAGVRYASCLLSQRRHVTSPCWSLRTTGSHPLRGFPAYQEMVENLKQWYAEPPAVEQMTVTGSYGLF